MEDRLRDLLHSDEQLRNTLHSNDKEKLRQKLELLQREHRRTFQRLRRAEHLDSVRGRIRSKIIQHSSHEQTKADLKPCSSAVEQNGTKERLQGIQNQLLSPGVATAIHNTTEKKTAGLSLLSDTPYTPTSDSSQDSSHIPKSSPALRLRSRRSRIRFAKRSGQSNHSSANSQEEPKETEKSTGEQVLNNAAVLHESEELFSPSECESPSLLLPHWNLQGQVEKEEIPNTLSTCLNVEKDDLQQANKSKRPKNPSETKLEKLDDGERLLDSCTLVEGLLFPAEYYVRTTRRMAVSQSQPDMNAIILSHLKKGRPRRGRGRGRPPLKRTSVDRELVLEASENNSPSSLEFSNRISCSFDGGVTSVAATPGRGKRGRRGRGRGRGRTPGHTARHKEDMKENASNAHANDVSPALPPPKFSLTGEEAVPEDVLTGDACGATTGVTESENVHTFNGHGLSSAVLQANQSYSNGLQKNAADWPSLLLPSSPQSDLPLLSPLPPISLFKTLVSYHIQDFHLPDDQFASLKLLKLRQINAIVEQFTPYNTPARNHCILSPQPSALSLSPTPDIKKAYSKQDISLAPKDDTKLVGKVLDLNEGENIYEKKTEHAFFCSEILNLMQESKNVTSSQVNQIKSNILVQDGEKISSPVDKSSALEKERNARCTSDFRESKTEHEIVTSVAYLSENLSLNINSVGLPKISINGNANCLNVKMENTHLESHVQSDCGILPKPEGEKLNHTNHPTQLLLSPCLDSASCPLTLPHLGYTPMPVMTPIKSPHSPSAHNLLSAQRTTSEARSPPALSPCPAMTPVESPRTPSSLALPPARRTISAEALSPPTLSPCPASPLRAHPPSQPLTPPSLLHHNWCDALSERGEGQPGAPVQECREETKDCTYTLKSPAGGSLVDVCCVPSSSGSVCVAAAGTWAVCLWKSQGHPSDWSLSHTWSFEEPVISVFPVPDAPDLFCVTLGKLEIRQVRVLSCCSLSQKLLCDCVVQTAMGAPNSRVVCSSLTSTTSIIRVFTLSNHTSAPHCLPLVSPGDALCSLASVEGLPDALLGIDESGSLLIWNMKTGHLLQKVSLQEGLSHSACMRGYSHSGVLFVLMQLHSLSSVKEQSEERGRALFSVLAVNPRNGKSVLAAQLCPPDDWCGRQCEADVLGCRLVALSQRGGVCVWDLENPREPPCPLAAPSEGEGWQLARWGGNHILLTALHTGDVKLHCYGDPRGTPLSQQESVL